MRILSRGGVHPSHSAPRRERGKKNHSGVARAHKLHISRGGKQMPKVFVSLVSSQRAEVICIKQDAAGPVHIMFPRSSLRALTLLSGVLGACPILTHDIFQAHVCECVPICTPCRFPLEQQRNKTSCITYVSVCDVCII